jgi:hypothetical protein
MITAEPPIACCDCPEEPYTPACIHVFNDCRNSKSESRLPFHFRFRTCSSSFEIVCEECGASGSAATHSLCVECADAVGLGAGRRRADICPDVVDKPVGLRGEIRPLVVKADLASATGATDGGTWFGITSDWRVIRFSGEDAHFAEVANLQGLLPADGPLGILSDRTGRMVAVFEECGSKAVVLDAEAGRALMFLDRGSYHTEQCNYPLAFFEWGDRTLLVHATEWNRLDVSDPRTGELLTARPSPRYQDKQRPAHYLDYFHCSLAVSPNAKWITSNGWVWHPWGSVRCWDLSRWINENVWESEDGTSLSSLCSASYYWDRPLCWVDENTVAWWGIGDDDLKLAPAIVVHDMETGLERAIFPGPLGGQTHDDFPYHREGKSENVYRTTGRMHFDRWLFAWKPGYGLSAWDLADGTRVWNQPDIVPAAYNGGRREFLCRDGSQWSVLRFTSGWEISAGSSPVKV